MADNFNYNDGNSGMESLKPWIPTIIMLFFFFPVGLVMLLIKLFGLSDQNAGAARQAARAAADRARREAQAAAQKARWAAQAAAQEARRQAQAVAQDATQDAKEATARAVQDAKEAAARAVQDAKEVTARAVQDAKEAAQRTAQGPKATARPSAANPKAARRGGAPRLDKREWTLRKRAADGKSLTVAGAVIAGVFGLGTMFSFFDMLPWYGISGLLSNLEEIIGPLAFCGGGLVMLYYGITKTKKTKRFRKYLALIGKRDTIAVETLAQAMGVSNHRACEDLQDMLDAGLFPTGFLDLSSGRLFLTDDGLQDVDEPEAPVVPAEPAAPKGMEGEDAVLAEIQQLNDAISDVEMSRKIDRIREITGKIFGYLRDNPDKEGQLRSFLSYYLPTTLKILRAYAQMESQGIEGDNITAAKARIEGMMDKVVDGFEKQLDKLFQDDAMDITTDVAVLERMLDKDGLGGGLQLGG